MVGTIMLISGQLSQINGMHCVLPSSSFSGNMSAAIIFHLKHLCYTFSNSFVEMSIYYHLFHSCLFYSALLNDCYVTVSCYHFSFLLFKQGQVLIHVTKLLVFLNLNF